MATGRWLSRRRPRTGVALAAAVAATVATPALRRRRGVAHASPASRPLAALLAAASALCGVLVVQRLTNAGQQEALRLNQERLTLALEGAGEALWDWDIVRNRLYYSRRGRAMLDFREHEISEPSDVWIQRVHPADRDAFVAAVKAHLCYPDEPFVCRFRLRLGNDDHRWVESRGLAHFDARGRATRMVGVMRDIEEEVRHEARLRQAAAVFDNIAEAVMIIDDHERIQAINQAFSRITGYSPEEVIGRCPALLRPAGHPGEHAQRQLLRELRRSGYWQGECGVRRKDGAILPVLETIQLVNGADGAAHYYVAILTDISAIKATEARLSHLAHHDPLTGLANRLHLQARLQQAIERAARHQQRVAVLYLDLDRFKAVNDTHGHEVGDQLLQVVAKRLTDLVRTEDTVARLGGDEFIVILEELDRPEDAVAPVEKIIESLGRPMELSVGRLTTSTSVGISLYPEDGPDQTALIRAADAAMYKAKQRGRGTYEYYTAELSAAAFEKQRIEEGLRRALTAGGLSLVYQPRVRLAEEVVVGVEALLRWQSAAEVVPPEKFLPIAEAAGLGEAIAEWVLGHAYAQCLAWHCQGLPPLRLALNFSSRQIASATLLQRLRRQLAATGKPPDGFRLDVEVHQNDLGVALENRRALDELREFGVGVSVDHFGTGAGPLALLRELPVVSLKIDPILVRRSAVDADARAILRASVLLGQQLGATVIGEGVEDPEQLGFLRSIGCDEAQGFLLSPPAAPEAIAAMLAGGPRRLH